MFFFITYCLEPLALLVYFFATRLYMRKDKLPLAKLLMAYYLSSSILQSYSVIESIVLGKSNIWLYEIAAVISSVCIGAYFYHLLLAPAKKKTVMALTGLYLTYAVLRQFTFNGQRLFDSIGYSLLSASVAVYVFMYFHQLLKNVTDSNLLREFNFWLTSGYLLYYLGSFIIFVSYFFLTGKLLENYTDEGRDLLMALWGLHNVLLFVSASLLLAGSLWVVCRRRSV